MSKSIAKKSAKNAATVVVKKTRKANPLHDKLVALMLRPRGATRTDIAKTKFPAAAIAALRIVERRGYKTSTVKKPGELTRYVAKRAGA
jgi:hypothetical protein